MDMMISLPAPTRVSSKLNQVGVTFFVTVCRLKMMSDFLRKDHALERCVAKFSHPSAILSHTNNLLQFVLSAYFQHTGLQKRRS